MRAFVFLWRDYNGNNAYALIETNSYADAWRLFDAAHSETPYAVFEGSNVEMREFTA